MRYLSSASSSYVEFNETIIQKYYLLEDGSVLLKKMKENYKTSEVTTLSKEPIALEDCPPEIAKHFKETLAKRNSDTISYEEADSDEEE
jgi:hypothetical protein